MKSYLALILLIVATGAAARADDAPDDASEKQALMALEHKWLDASKAKDPDAIAGMLADDYTYATPGGDMRTKADLVEAMKGGKMRLTSAAYEEMKVNVYRDAAVVSVRMNIEGASDDHDISGGYRVTDVFIKTSGQWKKVASHYSRCRD